MDEQSLSCKMSKIIREDFLIQWCIFRSSIFNIFLTNWLRIFWIYFCQKALEQLFDFGHIGLSEERLLAAVDIELDPGRLSRALVGGTQVWMDGQKFPHDLQDLGRCPKKPKQQKRKKKNRNLLHQQKDDLDGVSIPTPKIQQFNRWIWFTDHSLCIKFVQFW